MQPGQAILIMNLCWTFPVNFVWVLEKLHIHWQKVMYLLSNQISHIAVSYTHLDVYKRQRLTREFPDRAENLFERNEENAKARYEHLQRLIEMYK